MTADQLNEIIEYFEANNIECTKIGNKIEEIFIDVYVYEELIRFKVSFGENFPYTFPKVHILLPFYKNYMPLPHIDKNGFICTFDSNIAFPNINASKQLAIASVNKAIDILKDGISGSNKDDFINEFNSYWDEDHILHDIWCLEIPQNTRVIKCHYCSNQKRFYVWVNDMKNIDFIREQSSSTSFSYSDCLFIHLENSWYPPFPKTNSGIYNKMKMEVSIFNKYRTYLNDRVNKRSLVILGMKNNNEYILFSFIHGPASNITGFRKGRLNPDWYYGKIAKSKKILKPNVKNLEAKRLIKRGGSGIYYDKEVSISGCGSVGSYLVKALSEIGINKFTLIDREILTVDNISRHLCGASFVDEYKTDAIKNYFLKQSPSVKIRSFHEDIFESIKDIKKFNETDYNFVVIGNIPIELKFMELINNKKITKPIIIIWVEPYIIGAHALIIRNSNDVINKIYTRDFSFKYKILKNGGEFIKSESGCQSTYLPYSAFEVNMFIYNFLDFFQKKVVDVENNSNLLYSFGGKLHKARKDGILLEDFWIDKEDRIVRSIEL